MKKVLILAYDFPPYVSVGGLRPYSWFKYFHEFGVYPIVVTRQWSNEYGNGLDYVAPSASKETLIEKTESGEIIRTPYKPNLSNRLLLKYGDNRFKLVRKAITAYFEFAQYVFKVGPKAELYHAAKNYLKSNQVDVIIATADPYVLFNYASSLSKEFKTPWIADYRDAWTQSKEFHRNFIVKIANIYFEKKSVDTASCITTVSEFVKIKIGSLIKNKEIYIQTNGYDSDLINKDIKQKQDFFQIAFSGMIIIWDPIFSFLKTFSQLVNKYPETQFRLNFYGINKIDDIKHILDRDFQNLINVVTFTPRIPNKILIDSLSENNIMLLFNHYSYLGTKIYDYLGVKRKILLCYENDKDALEMKRKYYNTDEIKDMSQRMQADLLEKTSGGIVVQDEIHLQIILENLHKEFSETGQIACDSVDVENYSRKIQIEKLAGIIKSL